MQTPAALDFTNTDRETEVLGVWRQPLGLGPCSLSPGSVTLQRVGGQASCRQLPLHSPACLGLCPTAGLVPLTQTSLPDLIRIPGGHSASLSSLLLLYTDSRTTCLYGSYLYEPLDHRGTRKSSSRSTEKCQDQARLPELWLRSVQVPLHLWLPCACPMLPIFILCLLPKKESRQLPALGTWNHPRTVSSFQV